MSLARRIPIDTPLDFPPGWTIEHVTSRGYDSPDSALVAKHPNYATCIIGTGRHATAVDMEALRREAWLRHPQIKVIFLDVDEVLANWIGALLRLLGLDPTEVLARWDALAQRPWDVCEVLDISGNAMWREIDNAGADFWHDVEPFPWAHDLLALCRSVAPTYLLTSPSKHPSSLAGKLAWMQRHFGYDFRDYLVGPAKHACAQPKALLIDDSPHNCGKFVEHGGHALLFPGVGNDLHHVAPDERNAYVTEQLKGYRT